MIFCIRYVCWLGYGLSLILLFACSDPIDPSEDSEQKGKPATETILLHQGTNLAVAHHTESDTSVIALQGTLYLQNPGEENTIAITEWLDDAWEPDINPAGTKVIYEGYREGNWDLWQKPLSADQSAEQLTEGQFDEREPQYSPDGLEVIFSSDRGGSYDIWRLNLADKSITQLTDTETETHSPAWSPDGSAFAYVVDGRPDSSLYIQQLSTGAVTKVYESPGRLSALSWRPDGEALAFRTLDRDSNGNALSALRVVDIATGSEQILSPVDADVFPFRAQWLDNESLIYTSDGLVTEWQTSGIRHRPFSAEIEIDKTPYPRKTYEFDRGEPKAVLGISYPALSPKGDYLAYGALGDLYLWHIPSKSLTQLTDDPGADQSPSWSPDGKRLTYVSDESGKYEVWVYDLEAKTSEPIKIDRDIVSFPAFSPDGKKIAFFTDVPHAPLLHVSGQLSIFDLETRTLEFILEPMPPEPLAWSANGEFIITSKLVRYTQRYREGLYDLAFANVATGEEHTLRPAAHRSIKHGSYSAGASAVAYSQDGMLYSLSLTDDMQAKSAAKLLYSELADTPSWSANGRYIAFQAGNAIKRLDLQSGKVVDITPEMVWQREQPQESWILRAGTLFDGRNETLRHNVDIVIQGNRIQSLTEIDEDATLRVVDASDKTVIPGLFESHAHIGDHNLSEEQGRVWLAYGITSVRDPGSNPYLANERKEAWDSGRRIGPRTFITGHNIDGNRIFYAVSESIASDAHLERALQRSKLLEVDFIKTYVRLPNRQQKRVMEFAHAMGVPTTSHELLPAAAMGVDGIEHFTGTSRRGYTTKISELGRSYQDVEEVLVSSGMAVVPTLVVPGVVLTFSEQNDLYDTPSFNAFYGPAQKQNYQGFMRFFGPGVEGYVDNYGSLLSRLVARDALVGTGTDSPFTPFGTGMHAELRLYQREGLAPWQILHAASYQSARIAGAEKDLGSIEAGKLADMVVVDGAPLQDISELSKISMTVKNGRAYSVDSLRHPEKGKIDAK